MSESVFDKPLNGDLEALSSSVVKSINGKKPDPITGDITVIEGGGSGSYGAYRLDTTIPVSSWSGSGPYTVTIVNELIKSTMDGKSWLDNDTALLGETTLTSQDGSLLISTTVKPTEDWVLHVSFALNGADVLADSEEQKKAIGKIIPVITGTTNNSGYTINSGDYFEANGNLYKASATIPTNESWSSSSDALSTSALSDIHAKIGDVGSTSLQSQVTTLNSNLENYESFSLALPSGWQTAGLTAKKYLNIVFLQGLFEYSEGTTEKAIDLGNCIPSTYASLKRCDFIAFDNSTDEPIHGIISGKSIKLFRTATTSIKTITFNACYLT